MNTEPQIADLIWESEDDPPPDLCLNEFLRDLCTCLDVDDPELAVLVTTDERVRGLNHQYRDRDKTTDVLSFPSGAPYLEGEPRYLGDIVISASQARRQAEEIGHGLGQELRFLLLHGVLHLLGYDHETDNGEMMELQSDLKNKLSPYFGERRK
ncbi:MAG: rRNA maturation RNase YbeY [Acidobacteriota bacterium]|nr:rRNA maturation RNase YbeY [Acidobacteriota bacterium]